MIARIRSNSRAGAKARTSASQEQLNQLTSQTLRNGGNDSQGTSPPRSPLAQADGSHVAIMNPEAVASSLDPETVRLSLLAGIKYFAQLALDTTGKHLAYNLSHDEWMAVSRVIGQLSIDRSHFGGPQRASRLQSDAHYVQMSSLGR